MLLGNAPGLISIPAQLRLPCCGVAMLVRNTDARVAELIAPLHFLATSLFATLSPFVSLLNVLGALLEGPRRGVVAAILTLRLAVDLVAYRLRLLLLLFGLLLP